MKKILANDGIDSTGLKLLQDAGFTVITDKVAQADLVSYINAENISVLTVRSATQVRKDIIDNCPKLQIIGRGGVGMDNIDVDYAREKGIKVLNTPAASSQSVAELVIAHLFSMLRSLEDSNREMPINGEAKFNDLKKKYAGGKEANGATIGIIGFGRIGQAVAKIAFGAGMHVLASDPFVKEAELDFNVAGHIFKAKVNTVPVDEVLAHADIITLHVPGGEVIGTHEIAKMKHGVILINTARGGVINEQALLENLNSGQIAKAALDVFTNEPKPSPALLQHPKISLTPHIAASTDEAQLRIGVELAQLIISNHS
jgi:D-3-phosphoglycerate dehydrogenase / 2-oxoglutarate reductase